MNQSPALKAIGVSKRFGGLTAVNRASLTIRPGEIHGLIGPNGAGKSTMIGMMSGALKPTDGAIVFGQVDITRYAPARIAMLGVARTFQRAAPLPNLSVFENILVGLHARYRSHFGSVVLRTRHMRSEERAMRERARELIVEYGLQEQSDSRAGDLTFGQLRFLEIARAVARKPDILLLDEPAAGLNATETAELARLIRMIRDAGTGVLLVDHDVPLVFGLSDCVTVLDAGVIIANGSVASVRSNIDVQKAYLGEAAEEGTGVK
jgi:branched-chain amino acid transport system ATP-binding protein